MAAVLTLLSLLLVFGSSVSEVNSEWTSSHVSPKGTGLGQWTSSHVSPEGNGHDQQPSSYVSPDGNGYDQWPSSHVSPDGNGHDQLQWTSSHVSPEDNGFDQWTSSHVSPEDNGFDQWTTSHVSPEDNGYDQWPSSYVTPEGNGYDQWPFSYMTPERNGHDQWPSSHVSPEGNGHGQWTSSHVSPEGNGHGQWTSSHVSPEGNDQDQWTSSYVSPEGKGYGQWTSSYVLPKVTGCAGSTKNLALNKPATQSSTSFKGAPGRAVDGNRNAIYAQKSCSHTAMERNPWWRVDLGSSRCVDRVVVVKRQRCCGQWLEGFQVYVGDNPNVMENPKCGGLQSVKGKDVITVNCGGLTGRYVGIALPGKRQYLILCEVEVYGGSAASKVAKPPLELGLPPSKVAKAPPKLGQCAASTKNIALNRQAEQSSIAYRGAPGRAVDGNDSPFYRKKSCTHTKTETNPWWRVDLGKSECVHQVVVTNRKDCCSNKLNGFTVYVGDNPDVTSNPSCGGAQSVRGKDVITVNCGGLTGRYVGIALKGRRRVLTLCEVEVIGGTSAPKIPAKSGHCAASTTNIALNQQTTQSSTAFKGAPGRAVDGNRNAIYAQKSCSHTAMERNPWWRVDLGSSQCVDRVAVVKRQRCCGQWLEGFQVYVGDNPNVMENPKCGGLQSVKGKDVITVNCGGLTGRYVGIALPGKRQYLILCEVEVYGGSFFFLQSKHFTMLISQDRKMQVAKPTPKIAAGIMNLALNKPATQSSTGFRGAPGRAVDGNRNAIYAQKSCSHTAMERNPWWRVDLGSSQGVGRVVVVKRQRCCGQWLEGFQVYVGDNLSVMENPKCSGLQSVKGKDVITVNCGGLTGRYVGIALPGKRQYLILCEVEVYGAEEKGNYTQVCIKLSMHREPIFHMCTTIGPTIFLALLMAVTFLLPLETGERLGFAMTTFLAMVVTLVFITDTVPIGDFLPVVGSVKRLLLLGDLSKKRGDNKESKSVSALHDDKFEQSVVYYFPHEPVESEKLQNLYAIKQLLTEAQANAKALRGKGEGDSKEEGEPETDDYNLAHVFDRICFVTYIIGLVIAIPLTHLYSP
ncbi:uncharacterized protein LOC144863066 [Branchiostoma floridae x Branchiostoma japonicum]